jgi:hypothetical protein
VYVLQKLKNVDGLLLAMTASTSPFWAAAIYVFAMAVQPFLKAVQKISVSR